MSKEKVELPPSVYLSEKFFDAVRYATELHKDQTRKSTDITYISHPLGVASLILEADGDEDQAIGGLLHDIAEDCGGEARLIEIRDQFGKRVEAIVRGCSDSLVATGVKKAPWKKRKQKHIKHLKTADMDTLIVTAADKTHNARAIATDLLDIGDKVWNRFNADKEEILWYYTKVYKVLKKAKVNSKLLHALKSAIKIMEKH
jgi:(p)ppGpp synthase/HD superfamily hydrolase